MAKSATDRMVSFIQGLTKDVEKAYQNAKPLSWVSTDPCNSPKGKCSYPRSIMSDVSRHDAIDEIKCKEAFSKLEAAAKEAGYQVMHASGKKRIRLLKQIEARGVLIEIHWDRL
ncbi:MAG: hypothetical protein VX730_07815 [Pseudomonadota bacterium]|nr:hypothetical protein [Pseudomonadota bacterium]